MFRIFDASKEILAAYDGGKFNLEKWKTYMDNLPAGAKALCLADMEEVVAAGYTWEDYFLPVLNAVPDVGYYLGARFVRAILQEKTFDTTICYEIEDVKEAFRKFRESLTCVK